MNEMEKRNPRDVGVYEEGPGRYRVVVSTGRRLPSGRYGRVVRTVRGTKTDARNLRDQLRADVTRREYVSPARELLGVYLAAWLERVKPPHGKIKVSTWKSYESHVCVHLLPDAIADRRVADVTTTDVEDLFRRLLDKGLSPKEHDPDMAVLGRLGLDSGARLGELLAVTWPDVDTTRQTVRFRRSVSAKRMPGDERMLRFDTPKNDKARTLDVDASTIEALRGMRERQIAEGVSDVGQLVFRRPTRTGFQPWRPDVTTHVFQRLAGEAGVPVVPFHYLRHTCASWLLGAGMDVVAVSERLGTGARR